MNTVSSRFLQILWLLIDIYWPRKVELGTKLSILKRYKLWCRISAHLLQAFKGFPSNKPFFLIFWIVHLKILKLENRITVMKIQTSLIWPSDLKLSWISEFIQTSNNFYWKYREVVSHYPNAKNSVLPLGLPSEM